MEPYWNYCCTVSDAVMIYRRNGNLRAVQFLLGHSFVKSTTRNLGIEVDDAIALAEKIDI